MLHTHKNTIKVYICYNEQLLSIKSGSYNEYRSCNERGGILSADVARECE
jgi:hypothetical protein